ncbi:MAG: ABC transporter permease [Candidatus Woesearchaeota archaeon]
MKAMYVLWLRQVKRYFRSKPRIVGAMMQPLLFLLALGFGFGPIYAKAGGGNYIQFIAPGIIAMSILFTSIFSGVDIIWDRQFGFLKETLVAPVSRLELMLGRTLGGATVAVIQGSIVFIISLIVGFRPSSWSMLPVALLFMFLIAVAFTGLGTAIGSLMEDMQGFQLIMNFLIMPIFFLSGALFPLTELPRGIFLVTRFDPLSYGVDGLRFALTGTAAFSLLYDFLVMVGVGVLFVGMGSYFFSKVQL